MIKSLTKLMSNKALVALVFELLRRLAAKTKTTLDDQLLGALELALEGKDYGLQRVEPVKKVNAKTKKA